MKPNTRPPEGMRDFSPKDLQLRKHVLNTIFETYQSYGFMQIETPCVEKIEFLSSGEGGENEKMLFKILKRGEKLRLSEGIQPEHLVDLGLRYDLTVPLCRYYTQHKAKLPAISKLIQIGNVWRAERPQKGRFRQFTQCDIDIIGTKNIMAEIELILATSEALERVGFENFSLRINDRRILTALANQLKIDAAKFNQLFITIDKIDKIGLGGIHAELGKMSLPQSTTKTLINILEAANNNSISTKHVHQYIPNISIEVIEDLDKVINLVLKNTSAELQINFDLSLVRGMGYYTGQIFEISSEEFSTSIAGGGRYDKMISNLLQQKEEVPASGFSIGFERIISILEQKKHQNFPANEILAILYNENTDKIGDVLSTASNLRKKGISVSLEITRRNIRKQIDDLAVMGFTSFCFYKKNEDLNIKPIKAID